MYEVAENIYRLGRSRHNFYLIAQGGKATVIDAGGSSELVLLERALHHLDMVLNDVEAILITHAHTDHIGFAALASKQGIAVRVHEHGVRIAVLTGHLDQGLVPQQGVMDLPCTS